MTGAPRVPAAGRARRLRRVAYAVGYAVVALAVLLASGLLPVQAIRVPSESMTPTISPGDHLLLDRGDAGTAAVGDLVVVTDPLGDGLVVKRVVAVGGDTIGFEDGVLVRNGSPVADPFATPLLDGTYYGPDLVPPGSVYLLGDNRADSTDSRRFGPVPVASVVGHVVGRLFPSPGRL